MSTSRDSIDAGNTSDQPRHDWTRAESEALHDLPFADLIFRAQGIHRRNFDPNHVETASLLSIKTGGCPEDCGYCSQSAHYETGVKATRLMDRSAVVATARRLQQAGLDFYNHNVDTSPEFYGKIITTRTLQDRIDTLGHAREAGLKICCGGIVGMGEQVGDRLGMLMLLANLSVHPESVPINLWNEVKGVPVNDTAERPDPIALVRMIAVARIMMPKSVVRLSAGRQYMTDELQALCFVAGANSIFIGDVLLTTKNPQTDRDANLLGRLGMTSRLDNAAPAAVQIAGKAEVKAAI
jgi:biotin synthase